MDTQDEQTPEPVARKLPVSEVQTRLARIEQALDLVRGERLPAERELGERLMLLEGQIHYQARLTRMTMFVVLIVSVLFFGGTMFMVSQLSTQFVALAGQVADLARQGRDSAVQLADAVRLLSDIRGKLATDPSSVSSADINRMSSLVDRILGAENNGFMRNLQIQNELLDELEGKTPKRADR